MGYNLPAIPPIPKTCLIDVYRYYFWGFELKQIGLVIQFKRRDLKLIYEKIDLTDIKWNDE